MAELDVSLAICAYTEERWEQMVAAMTSAIQQTVPPREIVLVIDHNPQLYARARQAYIADEAGAGVDGSPRFIIAENTGKQGLSDARNTAIAVSSGALVAFLDDDAVAAPDWLARLLACFDSPDVLAAGGAVDPDWETRQPWWFPEEFLWVLGCSYRGLPSQRATIRNVMGGCMLMRRSVFAAVGGFRTEIGRIGKRPAGCEETELSIRAHQYFPQGQIVYEPLARIAHFIPGARTHWSYFRSRCYFEGRSKALIAQFVGTNASLSAERRYTTRVLPGGMLRDVAALPRHGDLGGIGRAFAIAFGLACTTAGYLIGTVANERIPAERFAEPAPVVAASPAAATSVAELAPDATAATAEAVARRAGQPHVG